VLTIILFRCIIVNKINICDMRILKEGFIKHRKMKITNLYYENSTKEAINLYIDGSWYFNSNKNFEINNIICSEYGLGIILGLIYM